MKKEVEIMGIKSKFKNFFLLEDEYDYIEEEKNCKGESEGA